MISFVTKSFHQLSTIELYQILQLRSSVFVVEQQCAYLDMDDKDYECLHVLGYKNDLLVAYSRLVPQGLSYKEAPAIGRVVSHPSYRKLGYGKLLMNYSINNINQYYQSNQITISAQVYLINFYQNLGFTAEGEIYLEDNIPHITMRYFYKK